MGGQTSRMLEYLLQKGDATESACTLYTGGLTISPLFSTTAAGYNSATGLGRQMIKSMTTISTPHNGSPLYTSPGSQVTNVLKDVIATASQIIADVPFGNTVYDFMLSQFCITQDLYVGGFGGMINAVLGTSTSSPSTEGSFNPGPNPVVNPNPFNIASVTSNGGTSPDTKGNTCPPYNTALNIWAPAYTDLASYDMGPQACANFNKQTQFIYPNTYYFSHATSRTDQLGSIQVPDGNIDILMGPTSVFIGAITTSPNACATSQVTSPVPSASLTCTSANIGCQQGAPSTSPTPFCYDNTWQQNDGLVPFRSSYAPILGADFGSFGYTAARVAYQPGSPPTSTTWQKGIWYYTNHTGNGEMTSTSNVEGTTTNGRSHMQIIGFDLTENGGDNVYNQVAQTILYTSTH